MDLKDYIKKYYPGKIIKYPHGISRVTDYDQDVIKDSIFIAKKGYKFDGTMYIDSAISKGAKSIFYDKNLSLQKQKGINYYKSVSPIADLARILKLDMENSDGNPIFIGVTGTSGKTSVTYLLYSFLKSLAYDVLLVGTHHIYSYYGLSEKKKVTENTTPSLSVLYKELQDKAYDFDYVIMEVSSQGIMEHRVLGLEFDVISITNLRGEHLDYHHTLSEYKIVKGMLLNQIKKTSLFKGIVLNEDDPSFDYFKNLSLEKINTFGLNCDDLKVKNLTFNFNQTKFTLFDGKTKHDIKTNLMGVFNIYNILNCYQIVKCLKINVKTFIKFLNIPLQIPGRMNTIYRKNRYFIVDYAHTINAVEAVLTFINIVKDKRHVTTIIGCGGNRDKIKRPIFGSLATQNSDLAIFTSDNPRDEDPLIIINEMVKGVCNHNYKIIIDRREAIEYAFKNSNEGDIILILGKGNENEIIKANGVRESYNDVKVVEELE